VLIPSTVIFVLYPLLMFVTTWRTIRLRVHPNEFLVFRYFNEGYATNASPLVVLRKAFCAFWREQSLFVGADTGQWETVRIVGDEQLQSEWNWFRIGFEPMFTDYTKSGTWFVLVSLFEWFATACVATLEFDNGVVELALLLAIQMALLVTILWLRPFVNKVVNVLETLLVAMNVITVALEAVSAIVYEEIGQPRWVGSVASTLQVTGLVVFILPLLVEVVVIIFGVARKLSGAVCQRRARQITPAEDKTVQRMVLFYTLRKWVPAWFVMVHRNSVACITDTWRGLQRSSQPGSDSNYHAADIHVDESFNGNWPNKDFGRPYKHVNDKGNLPVDQNFDAGLSNANCTAENRKGEEKTSIGTQEAKGYHLPPWSGKRGSGRV
ncbi:unnamed protein product, partial [Ascophyllum nodosum]